MFVLTTGWTMIDIDLSKSTIRYNTVPESLLRTYLGGSGLAAALLIDELELIGVETDPLAPVQPLLIVPGLLTGSPTPTASKTSICGRAPLTGCWGESVVGGNWGAQFIFNGWNGLSIRGAAKEPVSIIITPDEVHLLDASSFWGRDTFDTARLIHEKLRSTYDGDEDGEFDTWSASIGPAGENLVRYASVMFEGEKARAAGRCGFGALLGSKRVKCVTVMREHGVPKERPELWDGDALCDLAATARKRIRTPTQGLRRYGTLGGLEHLETIGDLPIENWAGGSWERGAQRTTGQTLASSYSVKNQACYGCSIGCGKHIQRRTADGAIVESAYPEYETGAAFGALCLNDDLESIVAANELANRLGLDTISTGAAIAFAIEAAEHGSLPPPFTASGSLPALDWGRPHAIIEMIEKIAHRDGLGDLLADGVARAAERIGPVARQFAIHVKGLELPMHDPRAFTSLALQYATANRGGCHLEGLSYTIGRGTPIPELGYPEPIDPHTMAGKPAMVVAMQDFQSIFNPLGLCKFLTYGGIQPSDIARWVRAATGWELEAGELMTIGARVHTLKRLYNIRLGLSRRDDSLPLRLQTQPRPSGASEGVLPQLEPMLDAYYALRGWTADGIPTLQTLSDLGLEHYYPHERTISPTLQYRKEDDGPQMDARTHLET